MCATGSVATAHRWSRVTRTHAMKLAGGVSCHTKQHVSGMTDGSNTMVWHCRILAMGHSVACLVNSEGVLWVDGFKAYSG